MQINSSMQAFFFLIGKKNHFLVLLLLFCTETHLYFVWKDKQEVMHLLSVTTKENKP